MERPMSYLLFKLTLEMAHVPTFNHDERVKVLYQEYLDNFRSGKNEIPASIIKFCKK